MAGVWIAPALGIAISLWMERWSKPAAPAIAIHCGTYAMAFALLLAVLQRPVFAAALALAGQWLINLVSDAKHRALREPLVFADIGLFSQALRHPRLYLPYLGAARALGAGLGALLIVAAGVFLEEAVAVPGYAWGALLAASIASIGLGARFAAARLALDPAADIDRHGLIASLWLYWLAERGAARHAPTPFAAAPRAVSPGERLPHIVVAQIESFFDARHLYRGVSGEVLARFDGLCSSAESGRLCVPAWGAYTMRTEFAFLSGIASRGLGVHRFNPYRRFARARLDTLATHLRALGYRTLCVHPYPASFFDRERVFPNLGFDEFLDLRSFEGARREGPYVCDAEVARTVIASLERSDRPAFVFAITMENHGPLHLERPAPGDAGRLYREAPGPGFDDLTVYLRHLRNSDAMLGELAGALERAGSGSVLCAYGDHVPSMPGVYAALGFEDSRTDYLIWRPGAGTARRVERSAEELGLRLLEVAGLATGPG